MSSCIALQAEAAEYDLVISKLREDLVLSVQASSMTETAGSTLGVFVVIRTQLWLCNK